MKKVIKHTLELGLASFARFPLLDQNTAYRLADISYRYRDRETPYSLQNVTLSHGIKMELDLRQWQDRMMAYHVYEPNLRRFLQSVLRPGDHFIDVGANIGFFSLFAEKLVGPMGNVDAFEPSLRTRKKLTQNLSLNNSRVRIRDHALGAVNGTLNLIEYGNASGLTSRFDRGADLGERTLITCPQSRLDSLSYSSGATFIKLDCEGSEGDVILGAEKLISGDCPPIIYFEYCQEWRDYGGTSLIDLCDCIKSYNETYQFYDLDQNLSLLNNTLIEQLNHQNVVNICCMPNRKQE